MAGYSWDLDRISVTNVNAADGTGATITKPAGARAVILRCNEAFNIHGGDRTDVSGGATLTPASTNAFPVAADTNTDWIPCAQLKNIKVTPTGANFTAAVFRAMWLY